MMNLTLNLIMIMAWTLLSGPKQFNADKCIIKSEFIYNLHDVPFPQCHASTIIQTNKGLMAAWFGGTAERNPDVGIWVSDYNGSNWSIPVEVANGIQYKDKRYPCWNPALYYDGRDILLFYKVGPSPSEWWGELMISHDEGKSWTRHCRLPEDIYGPIKNKPVMLDNGELICPSSTENDGWRVHMEFTSDNGLSWDRTQALNDKKTGAIQPTILVHQGGKIQMLCRSKSGWILSSWSDDYGHNWSELSPTSLPNPNSGIDAVTLSDGRHLLVYNHLKKGRQMLNAAISDDGKVWNAAFILENDAEGKEYSYPAVIQTNDGLVHITYTWNRTQIKHVVIDPGKIISRSIINGEWPSDD